MNKLFNKAAIKDMLCVALVCLAIPVSHAHAALLNVRSFGVVGDGATDDTAALQSAFTAARDGDLLVIPAGKYSVKPGSVLTIGTKVTISGTGAELVNGRLLILSDIVMRGLTISENDCFFTTVNPGACPVTTPLVTIGYKGYPIHSSILEGLTLTYTRAYTGIAMGYDTVENVTISDVNITANALSAISIYGGSHIRIINGTMRGGDFPVVDDGIAITALYQPIHDVNVSGMKAENIFDLVGIGAEMVNPTDTIAVTSSQCVDTSACIYVKLGNDQRLPGVVGAFSTLQGLLINNIQITDLTGKRYLTSIWMAAAGGAQGNDIRISGVNTTAQCATATSVGVKFLVTANSQLTNVTLSGLNINTPAGQTTGYVPNEGILVQTLDQAVLSNVRLTNSNFSNIKQFAVDSTNGQISNLTVYSTNFNNVRGVAGAAPSSSFVIPFPFVLNDQQTSF